VFSTLTSEQENQTGSVHSTHTPDEGITAPAQQPQSPQEEEFKKMEADLQKQLAHFSSEDSQEMRAQIESARQTNNTATLQDVQRKIDKKRDEEAKELQQKLVGGIAGMGMFSTGGMGFLNDILKGGGINFEKLVQGGSQHFDASQLFTPAITPGSQVAMMRPLVREGGMGLGTKEA
jgi:hypothetical protein